MQKPIKGNMSISATPATVPGPRHTAIRTPVDFSHVRENSNPPPGRPHREASPLGKLIWQRMADLGMRKQVDLVRRPRPPEGPGDPGSAGLSDSTISRLMWESDFKPKAETLAVLADVIQVDRDELLLFVHGGPPPKAAEPGGGADLHPLMAEGNRMLAPDSPLSDEERAELRMVIERAYEYYRLKMTSRSAVRRRRSA